MSEGPTISRGDPVLDAALAEMESAGALDQSAPVTEPTPDAVETPAPPAVEGAEPTPAAEPAPKTAPSTPDVPAKGTPAETPASTSAPAAVDPLKGTEPFTITVNGQAKAIDGLLLDKENGGAFILPDKLELVTQALVRGEQAQAAAQQLWEKAQEYEAAGGVQKLRDLELLNAQMEVAGSKVLDTLKQLLAGDENKPLLDSIIRELSLDIREARYTAQEKFKTQADQRTQSQQVEQQRGRALDVALAKMQEVYPVYNAEDMRAARVFLTTTPEAFFRPATPQEAQVAQVKPGEIIIDYPRMNAWAEDRAAFRNALLQQEKDRTAKAEADEKARKFNTGQEKGRQPVPKKGAATTPAATEEAKDRVSKGAQWEAPLETALAEMGINR